MTWQKRSWDPTKGKWKMGQVIQEILKASWSPITTEQLVRALGRRGYHPDSTRWVLPQFVDIDDEGHVTWKTEG